MHTMHRLFFALALLLAAPAVLAQAPPSAPAEARAQAPAAVLSHTLRVSAWGRSMETVEVWSVRVDDPKAAIAGLPAPPSMDGATSRGAAVRGDRLVLPMGSEPGTTWTFKKTTRASGGPFSGAWNPGGGLPVERASAEIRASSSAPLSVWLDEHASASWRAHGGRGATATWEGEHTRSAQVVWSTWPDWLAAGAAVNKRVDRLISTQQQMGRRFAADLSGISVGTGLDRVMQGIRLEGIGSWSTARNAADVAADGRGTAAERGVLLISILRAGGHDARPALFRPAGAPGATPLTVPAPALLERPAVVVLRPSGPVWLDPASPHAAPGEIPASMHGGVAWLPGDVPVHLAAGGVVDGEVSISGTVAIDRDGGALWSATLTATGVAQEQLRDALGPLTDRERSGVLYELVSQAHPSLQRFTANATTVERTHRPLKITVQAYEPAAFRPLGAGLSGQVNPLLAAPLAGILRSRILVHEELSVSGPGHLTPLTASATRPSYAAQATVSRSASRQGQRLILVTEVERHERAPTDAEHAAASAFLEADAREGIALLFQPPASKPTTKALLAEELPIQELRVIEALLWWASEDERRARKALVKGIDAAGWEAMAVELERRTLTGDPRPWLELHAYTGQPAERMRAVLGLERAGARELGWRRASRLLESDDPAVRLDALLAMERMLPDARPDADEDPEGYSGWLPREEILSRATAEAELLPAAAAVPVWVRQAERAMAEGRTTDAEVLLERALAVREDGGALVLLAEAGAASGVGMEEVVDRIAYAVRTSPFDAEVAAMAARATQRVGRRDLAHRYAVSAARLAADDAALWRSASSAALAGGDLDSALFAARRASDLEPTDAELTGQLDLLATLAHDQAAHSTAARRQGVQPTLSDWPPDLDELLGMVPPEGLLALLQHHDRQVVGRADLLAIRAQLRLEAGLLDEAARDGALLDHLHGDPSGVATAFAATAGRMWSPELERALGRAAATDPLSRAARMEHRLITASGDAAYDARRASDDPRAATLLRLLASPSKVAAEVPGWPADVPEPRHAAPRGFRSNAALGIARGVYACSDPVRGVAILRAGRITGAVPAPLGLLYTPSDAPLRSLPGGGQVIRLEGGVLPLYAAVAFDGEQEVFGLGFTAARAEEALDIALK